MSTAKQRLKRFQELYDSLGQTQSVLATWMSLENTKQSRESVSRKYRGAVGVTPKDIALMNILLLLHKDGYDLRSVKFTDDGELYSLNRTKGYED